MRLLVTSPNCFPDLKDFISSIVCDSERRECMLQTCISCENLKVWQETCQNKLEGDDQSVISYQQLQTSEKSGCLEKFKLEGTVIDIFDTISMKWEHFLFHDFVKNSQSLSLKYKKESLDSKSIIIHFDFSENYEFISQGEIQNAHSK